MNGAVPNRRRLGPMCALLLVAALLAALIAATAQARPGADGSSIPRLTLCPGARFTEVGLATHGMSCRSALTLVSQAADADRYCPRGWVKRSGVRPTGRRPGFPALTMCSQRRDHVVRAFAYLLPSG